MEGNQEDRSEQKVNKRPCLSSQQCIDQTGCGGARTADKLRLPGRLTPELEAKRRKEIRTEVLKKVITLRQNFVRMGNGRQLDYGERESSVSVVGVRSGDREGTRPGGEETDRTWREYRTPRRTLHQSDNQHKLHTLQRSRTT